MPSELALPLVLANLSITLCELTASSFVTLSFFFAKEIVSGFPLLSYTVSSVPARLSYTYFDRTLPQFLGLIPLNKSVSRYTPLP